VSQSSANFANQIFAMNNDTFKTKDLDAFAKGIGNVNSTVLHSAKLMQEGKLSTDDFKKVVAGTVPKLDDFAMNLKNIALNMGAMLAVMIAIKAVTYIVDELYVSFEEQKEIVEDLTNSIDELQSEYDTLKADGSGSNAELNYLKKQIDYKKDLLEIEKERLALKDIEENMPDLSSDTGTSGGHVNATWTPDDIAESDIQEDLRQLEAIHNRMEDMRKNGTNNASNYVYQNQLAEEARYMQSLSDNIGYLKEDYAEIAEAKAKLEEYISDGILKGYNAEKAKEQIIEYQKELNRLDPIILNAEIELGTANFEDKYNAYLDKIKKANSMENLGVSEDKYRDVGYGGTLIKSSELDSLIDKNKELNTTFQSGEITASEYFNSLSKMFEKGGKIADAYDKLDFDRVANESGKWVLNSTDYLEETVSQLVSQITDATYEVTNAFARGDISVKEYYDSLQESADAQLKALKTTNKLTIGTDDLAYATEDSSEQTKQAVEHYNELHNQLEEMDIMEQLVDVNTKYADTLDDIGTATEDMLNDASIQNYVSEASNAVASYMQQMHSYYETTGQDFQTLVNYFNEVAGSSFTAQELLSKNSADIISDYFGDTMSGVTDLATAIATMTGDVIADGASKIGDVLTALGDTISNFDYTLNISTEGFDIPWSDIITLKGISLPPINAAINFDGSGESVGALGDAIKGVGDWVKTDATQLALKNIIGNFDSWKPKNNGSDSTSPYTSLDSPTDKDSSGGSGSSKDPHVAEIDKYKELTDAVEDYDRQLERLENAYDHTDNVKERIGLKQAEIQIYQRQKDAIDALNKARDVEISQNVELLRKQGFKITYDPNTEQLIIHNREHINDLSQDIIETYEDLIETTDELNDANKDSADQWDELTYAIVDAGKELTELRIEQYEKYITEQEHLLKLLANRDDALKQDLPIYDDMMDATLKMWQELVDDGYEKNKEQIQELEEAWMDFYDSRIEREKELLEKQLDDNDDALDAIIKVIEDEIEAIDDQIDSLKEANDERKKALELQKAQAELDKQRNQKTRLVLRKGKGWVWESDEDAVKEAEENVSDLKYEQQVDKLEKEKEKLEDLKELWEEIPDIKQNEWNEQLMIDKLGADAEEDILSGRIDVMEDFRDDYTDIQQQIKDKTDELEQHTSDAYTKIVKEFERLAKLAGIDFNLDDGEKITTTQSSWYVNKNGKAPSQAQVGDIVYTKGGTYRITAKDENGKFTSEKINDKSTDIAENQWGKKISERVIASGEDVVDSVKDIIRTNEDLVDAERRNILTSENLSKYIVDGNTITEFNSDVIDDNTDETEDLSDDTEENSEVTEDNTSELKILNNNLENLEKLSLEELPEDPFEMLDWGSMTTDEKNWINQMRDAYMIALEQGNEVFANQILGMLSDFQAGYGDEYIQIGKDAYNAATNPFGYEGKTSTGGGGGSGTEDRIADLKWLKSKVDEDPSKWSDKFKDTLERAIAIEEYGSGTDSYKYNNGYMTTTITSATNEAENYMTAEEIKMKYDYEHGNTNNGYDPEKMAETVADRIAEAIEDGADSIWGGFLPKDFDYATEVIKDNEESLKDYIKSTTSGSSSGNKTSSQKAMDDNKVSQSDRDKIADAQKKYNEAKAKGDTQGMADAHKEAESIRNSYGYSGGVDGSENIRTTSANTKSVSENTKATTYNADSTNDNTDSMDANSDSVDKNTKSNESLGEKLDKGLTVNVTGTGSGSGSSGSKGGSGGGSYGSNSLPSEGRVKWTKTDNGDGTTTHTAIGSDGSTKVSYTTKNKKAKGGLNLKGDIYNVNEKGDEIVLDKPEEGNWIRINTGGTVIPHEAAENMWEFGANPKMFLSDLLGYDAMKMNQQMVYMGGTGESKTIIENHYHDMHFHDVKDMDGVKQILAGLPAHAEQHCTSRTRSVRTV